jgi:hypothetical protein
MTEKTNTPDWIDPSRIERLRELAREGRTVAEMVHFLKDTLSSQKNYIIMILIYFEHAFALSLREARNIEGAHCMGNKALTDDELDSILRPLILERLPPPCEWRGGR